METQSTRSPALVTTPRRQGRRQTGLSASDRFWMVLGSVTGLALVPATGIALLSETTSPPQDRPTGLPETDPRDSALAGARDLVQASEAAPVSAPVAAAARPGSAQQKSQGSPAAESGAATEATHPPREVLSDGGSSSPPAAIKGGIDNPFLRHTSGAGLGNDTLLSAGQSAGAAVPPGTEPQTGEPSLATVLDLGTDPDTWGIKTSYLIVSRPQDHMVETADGVLHMVINRGLGHGLTLVSSDDGGATWDTIYTFGPGNPLSTSDIRLIDGQDVMIVSYLDAGNDVAFAMLGYDSFTGAWTLLEQTVIDSDLDAPDTVHASIVLAPDGTLLIAYTDEVEGGLRLTLQQSTDGGQTWTETVLDQPGIPVGSARVLSAAQSEGIVYSNPDAMYWVTWDASGAWQMEVIDPAGTIGAFASHFSTVTADGDVVLANVGTDLKLRVMRLDGATGDWSDPVLPIGAIPATNVQISISDDTGHLYIVYDDVTHPGSLVVLESRDGGATWETEALLQTPPDMVSPPTRFEAPEHFTGDLVVTQQILAPDEGEEGLYVHVVDVDGPERPWTEVTPLPADDFVF